MQKTPVTSPIHFDRFLASEIVKQEVIQFGPSEKNKNDSPSCLFDPRKLLSAPRVFNHIANWTAQKVIELEPRPTLVGMATSGIAWASAACAKGSIPMMYVRKSIEKGVSSKLIEGTPPADRRVVLIDDLLFAGESKRQALKTLETEDYIVTDIVVVIDRQLQRVSDGPSLEQIPGIQLHSMINMSDVVDYLIESGNISDEQLMQLIADYRRFERWNLPRFAQ